MWNWKKIYEDDECICFCDINNVIDPVCDEDSIFPSVTCYRGMAERVATWISLGFKKKSSIMRYVAQRKRERLPVEGYEEYRYTLCVIELDAEKKKYRIIPAIDFDSRGNELGTSTILNKPSITKGLSAEWSNYQAKGTHKVIHALCKFFYQ
jgi:hypothetical protein